MKKVSLLFACIIFTACNKPKTQITENKIDSTAIIDSINAMRTQINDSIRNKNRFPLMSGTGILTHDLIKNKGKVSITKVEGNNDEYTIEGSTEFGKNYLKIKGNALRVSNKHFNFTGEITQSIQENDNGKIHTRKGTKTFLSKDNGKTWRLQEKKPNPSGFVDIIEIKL